MKQEEPLVTQILKRVIPHTMTWDEVIHQCREEFGFLSPTPLCYVPASGPENYAWIKLAMFPGHGCSYMLPKENGDSEWLVCVRPPERGPVFLPLVPITITHSESQRSFEHYPKAVLLDRIKGMIEAHFKNLLDRNFFYALRRFAFEPEEVPSSKIVAEASHVLWGKRGQKNLPISGGLRVATSHEGYQELLKHSEELHYLPVVRDTILRGSRSVVGGWTYMFVAPHDMASTLFLTTPTLREEWISPTEENPDILPVVEHTLSFSVGLLMDPLDWATLQQAELVSSSPTPM